MAEHGKKLLPVTLRVNCPDPTAVPVGESNVTAGAGKFVAGAVTEKGSELERAKPFDTVMGKDPWVSASEKGMMAVRYGAGVGFPAGWTNVVGRGEPFQLTTEPPFTKFVPFTVRVKLAGLHSGVEGNCVVDANKEVIAGVRGWLIVNVAAGGAGDTKVVPPPGPGVNTTT